MSPRPPSCTCLLAGSLTLFGTALPSVGEEFLPSAIDRATTRVDQRLQRPESLRRSDRPAAVEEGWDIGLIVSVAYDDNIFLSSTNEESDFVIRATPRFAYSVGDPAGEKGGYARVAYQPTAVVYLDNRDDSRIDHNFVWDTGYNGDESAINYGGYFRRLGDATADTGNQTDRSEYAHLARVAWLPKERIAIELAAALEGVNYDSSLLADSTKYSGGVALRYIYSPKTQVVLAYRGGREEVDGSSDQDFHRVSARLAWSPRQKIRIDLEAGAEHRDYAVGSDTYPVFEGRIDWLPREGTSLYVAGYRRMEVSAFSSGQNYTLTGVTAGVAQQISRCWLARLEGGYERSNYRRVSGTGPAGREDEIFFIRPSAEYSFNEDLRLNIFYQYSRNDSRGSGFGYTNHQVGAGLERDF